MLEMLHVLCVCVTLRVLNYLYCLDFVGEMICFVNFQVKEQKVVVDELSKLKKNRVS